MMTANHITYLERCMDLAQIAASEGESPVGSIVVLNGKIIGEGSEKSRQEQDVTRHAEVVALLNAIHQYGHCEGATLYTNMEPCILCSYVIRHYKIATVIFTNYCGELGGTNPLFNILTTDAIKAWQTVPEVIFQGNDI